MSMPKKDSLSVAVADGPGPSPLKGVRLVAGATGGPPETERGAGADLAEYHDLKLALAAQLRLVREAFKGRGDEVGLRRCEELLVKLAEDRFTLGVLGQFKRGKSSLLNAIIGRDLLPVGVLPLTSAITILRFGGRERLLIERWSGDRTFTTEEPLERLASYVTESGNPGNRLGLRAAYLESATRFLRRGVEFVDTPGVGSAIEANTATTRDFLPSCDAAVFVTSVDAPLTEAELHFLAEIRQHLRRVFFVVNKVDLLEPVERAAVLDYTTGKLREATGVAEIRVYGVSSRQGLAGSLRNDPELIRQSGLPQLQSALATFLAEERTQSFLHAVVYKALGLLDRLSAEESLAHAAQAVPEAILREKLARVEQSMRASAVTRAAVRERLREQLLQATKRWGEAKFEAAPVASEALMRLYSGLLRCFWWQPGRLAMRRIGPRLARWHARRERRWLTETTALDFAVGALPTAPAYRELRVNLEAMSRLAAEAFAVPAATPRSEEVALPKWTPISQAHPAPGLDLSSGAARGVIGAWPTMLGRQLLRNTMRRALRESLEAHHREVLEWVIRVVGREFDTWGRSVEAAAEGIRARLVAIAAGQRPGAADSVTVAELRRQLVSVEERIRGTPVSAPENVSVTRATATAAAPTFAVQTPKREESADFRRDLRTRGCPVCDHLVAVAGRIFAGWQYELYAKAEAQSEYAQRGNLCGLHLWQLEAMSSPVGVAVGHAKRVEHIARVLRNAADAEGRSAGLEAFVPGSGGCRVCEQMRRAETRYLEQLFGFLRTADGRAVFARSQGPCLRHLIRLVELGADGELRSFLLSQSAQRFAEMAEDMQSFGLKTEALRRGLRNEDEEDAWWRALCHIAGSRRLTCALTCDGEI